MGENMNKIKEKVREKLRNELKELYQYEAGFIIISHPKSGKFFQYTYGDSYLDLSFPVKGVNFETSNIESKDSEHRGNTKEDLEKLETILAKKDYILESSVKDQESFLCAIPENKGIKLSLQIIGELWGEVSDIEMVEE